MSVDGNNHIEGQNHPSNTSDPIMILKNIIILIVITTAIFLLLWIVLYNDEYSFLVFSDIFIDVAALSAFGIALVIVYGQKLGGLHGKTYAAFALGLALWVAAELIQTYYEIGTDTDVPYPSTADALWLLGYAPFAYHLFANFSFFKGLMKSYVFVLIILGISIIFGLVVQITISRSEIFAAGSGNVYALLIDVAYPILDAILIVPAIALLTILYKGRAASLPWILLSASILIIAIADSAFGYFSAAYPESNIWNFSIFYFVGYLCMIAALYCHKNFFIFNKSKAVRMWQERNR